MNTTKAFTIGIQVINVTCSCGGDCVSIRKNGAESTMIEVFDKTVTCSDCGERFDVPAGAFVTVQVTSPVEVREKITLADGKTIQRVMRDLDYMMLCDGYQYAHFTYLGVEMRAMRLRGTADWQVTNGGVVLVDPLSRTV